MYNHHQPPLTTAFTFAPPLPTTSSRAPSKRYLEDAASDSQPSGEGVRSAPPLRFEDLKNTKKRK